MKADGSTTGEKVVSKEDSEKSVRTILTEKLDTKIKQNEKDVVDRLMKKFFDESWEYMDPGNEGFIEVSRAHSFIHRIIN